MVTIAREGDRLWRITLVPFAGLNLIRFRGSRINGLSPCFINTGHSDKILHFILQAASLLAAFVHPSHLLM